MNVVKASAAALFIAMGTGLLMAAPANASEVPAGQDPAAEQVQPQGAPAPNCIKAWSNSGTVTRTAYAKNNCHSAYRLKIIWAYHADGACATVQPGQTRESKIAVEPGRFDGVQRC